MIAFKSCPHCHGDLYVGIDNEPCCLQCGYEPRPNDGMILPVGMDMTVDQATAGTSRCLAALAQCRQILLDTSRNCVDRLSAAWLVLQHLTADDLPPALRREWTKLSERASRVVTASGPVLTASVAEAADVASILLLLETLLQRNLMPQKEGLNC